MKAGVAEYTLEQLGRGAAETSELIEFFERDQHKNNLSRPDLELIRACERRSAFVIRRVETREIRAVGMVFQYLDGFFQEAGAARVLHDLNGYGLADWGMTLHEFIHRGRFVHTFLKNSYMKGYLGIVREDNRNNRRKLNRMGFRKISDRVLGTPVYQQLVLHRQELIDTATRLEGRRAQPRHSRDKLWMALPLDREHRLKGDLVRVLASKARIRSRYSRGRTASTSGLSFRLRRARMERDEQGRWAEVPRADTEEIVLHVTVPLLTTQVATVLEFADL